MHLVSEDRLFFEKNETVIVTLAALAFASFDLAQDKVWGLRHKTLDLRDQVHGFIRRCYDGCYWLAMPDIYSLPCRLVATEMPGEARILFIDRALYRGDLKALVTEAIKKGPFVDSERNKPY